MMPLEHLGFIDLPAHVGTSGFDHAAVHGATGRRYVAHTANDAVDVIDLPKRQYVKSITGLPAVAGRVPSRDTSRRGISTEASGYR